MSPNQNIFTTTINLAQEFANRDIKFKNRILSLVLTNHNFSIIEL